MNTREKSVPIIDYRAVRKLDPKECLAELLTQFGKPMEIGFIRDINQIYSDGLNTAYAAEKMFKEEDYENAYVLYNKLLQTFPCKIAEHPHYDRVSHNIKSALNYKLHQAKAMVRILEKELSIIYTQLKNAYLLEHHMKNRLSRSIIFRDIKAKYSSMVLKQIRSGSVLGSPSFTCSKLLKTLVLPNQLTTIFQIKSQNDTKKNKLTWASLAGKKIKREYVITHLILAQSIGKAEIVQGLVEKYCDDFMEANELTPLGWVHIHRSSSCFLSAPDIHQQWRYQCKVPEAVSIVCSPLYSQVAIYTLLPYGMDYIENCKSTSFFHTHKADKALYSEAKHVRYDFSTSFEVIDFIGDENQNVAPCNISINKINISAKK